jgi:hypothetical protein
LIDVDSARFWRVADIEKAVSRVRPRVTRSFLDRYLACIVDGLSTEYRRIIDRMLLRCRPIADSLQPPTCTVLSAGSGSSDAGQLPADPDISVRK